MWVRVRVGGLCGAGVWMPGCDRFRGICFGLVFFFLLCGLLCEQYAIEVCCYKSTLILFSRNIT